MGRYRAGNSCFHDFEREFHLLGAHEKAQVLLPKATKPLETVHEPLEPSAFPWAGQLDMKRHLTQFESGIPMSFAVEPLGSPEPK